MKTKAKGFTVLELIITLAITVMVLGVIYTFFFASNKTLSNTTINSDLQRESELIQKELIFYGTQANNVMISNSTNMVTDDILYSSSSLINGKLDTTKLEFVLPVENGSTIENHYFIFERDGPQLSLKEFNKVENRVINNRILSENVIDFKIRPLDFRNNPTGSFKTAPGFEITLILNMKKGYSDITMPISVIVKFRNK